jgi:hypothetical protein
MKRLQEIRDRLQALAEALDRRRAEFAKVKAEFDRLNELDRAEQKRLNLERSRITKL